MFTLKKIIFIGLVAFLTCGILDARGVKAEEKLSIAIVYPIIHPFFNETTRGAEEKAEELGVDVTVLGPEKFDVAQQLQILEDLIAKGVNGIAVGATDPKAVIPVVNKAMEQGIKVTCFDTDSPDSKRLSFIGTDNLNAGRHAGEVMTKLLNGKGEIIVSMGVPTQLNLVQRLDGFKEVLAKSPEMKIVDIQSGHGDPEKTLSNIENMLQAHPEADGLFGVDAAAGPGAVVAFKAAGATIPVVTFDDLPEILDGIREGIITYSIVQRQYKWGVLSVQYLVDAINGKSIPPIVDTGTVEVTKENVDTYLEVQQ